MERFSQLHRAIMGGMRRRKSEKLSDKDLLSQVKKALGKPRVAQSIRKSNSNEIISTHPRRSLPKTPKAK
jgi:hypothetical protein